MNPLKFFRSINKKYSRFWLLLISFLGFGACQKHGGEVYPVYGVPAPALTVKGNISSAAGTGINGIKVVMNDSTTAKTMESTFSVDSGKYYLTFQNYPNASDRYTLHFEDVDGTVNGSYKSKDTTFSLPSNIIDNIEVVINVKLDSK